MFTTISSMALNNVLRQLNNRLFVSSFTTTTTTTTARRIVGSTFSMIVPKSLLSNSSSRLYYSPRKIRDSLSDEEEYTKSSPSPSSPPSSSSSPSPSSYTTRRNPRSKPREEKKKKEVDHGQRYESRVNDHKMNNQEDNDDSFQNRRVFVQGLSSETTWQDLKDHFRQAGEVAYASISNNGRGHAIVQYETAQEAKKAIKSMRDFPLHDKTLYVREDVQEQRSSSRNSGSYSSASSISSWKCAHDTETISDHDTVLTLIKSRNQARIIRDYTKADDIRKQLLAEHSVHVDDTLKLYWNDSSKLSDIKGTGSWKATNLPSNKPWRQIPTTTQKDDLVHSNLIYALLRQRDEARRDKLFDKADQLLDQIVNAPNQTDIVCKISDEHRTWKVWSTYAPQQKTTSNDEYHDDRNHDDVKTTCLRLVHKYQPEKIDEAYRLLQKFEGREEYILEKLKTRFGL